MRFPVMVFMFLLLLMSSPVKAEDPGYQYWTGSRVNQVDRQRVYTTNMHTNFTGIRERYEEGGRFFYSNVLNTFGEREALNLEQEVVFCEPGDQNFSSTVIDAAGRRSASGYGSGARVEVTDDATNSGLSPFDLELSIEQALVINANDNAKGRFCYDENNYAGRIDYRNPNAASAVYCDPASSPTLGFDDEVSGFGCGLDLDIPLKAGETRFIRQVQENQPTIAQGFVGCYNNPSTGQPELTLIQNPQSCSASSRGDCLRTCDWANQVVCSSRDMPSWGAACKAVPTQLFKGDSISVESSMPASVDSSGKRFQGNATMSCQMVGESAQWVVTSSSCTQVGQ